METRIHQLGSQLSPMDNGDNEVFIGDDGDDGDREQTYVFLFSLISNSLCKNTP